MFNVLQIQRFHEHRWFRNNINMEQGMATLSLQVGYAHGFVLRSRAWAFSLLGWLGGHIWFYRNAGLNTVGTHGNKQTSKGRNNRSCMRTELHNYRRTDHQGDFKMQLLSRLLLRRHISVCCSSRSLMNSEVSHIPYHPGIFSATDSSKKCRKICSTLLQRLVCL